MDRVQPKLKDKPLLVQRAKAARLLGCCTMTLARLEKSKALEAIRLSKRTGRVYYRMADIEALAERGLQ